MGLFHRYAGRKGGAHAYATEAAYPFYILHQTVIVLIASVVVQWGVGIPLKYTLIAATSFVLTRGRLRGRGEALESRAPALRHEAEAAAHVVARRAQSPPR